MHILLITNDFPRTWQATYYIFYADQAIALKKAGHQVGVLVEPRIPYVLDFMRYNKRPPMPISRNFWDSTIPVYRTNWGLIPKSSPKVRTWGKLLALRHTFKQYCKQYGQPDIIHAHNTIYSGYLATQLAKEASIPIVLTEHFSGYWRGIVSEAQMVLVKQTLEQADEVLAVSRALADTFVQLTGVNRSIGAIGNIVDVEFFYKTSTPKLPFTFASITRFDKNKSVDGLLKAFHQAFQGTDVTLSLAGDGELMPEMKQLVSELGIDKQVKFLGRINRDAIRDLIQSSHAVVSSSQYETFGITLIEAMACGRPIIATRSGGPEMFINDQNGLLVPTQDVNALASAMQCMIKTYNNYDGTQIRRNCVQQFSERAIVNRLETIYEALL